MTEKEAETRYSRANPPPYVWRLDELIARPYFWLGAAAEFIGWDKVDAIASSLEPNQD